MRHLIFILAFYAAVCFAGAAGANEYFIAPDGRADNDGTMRSAWDIESVFAGEQDVQPGSTIYMREGVYRRDDRSWGSDPYRLTLQGEEDNPIHIRPYKGGRVTIDQGMVVQGARQVWLWNLEFTISESAEWARRVDEGSPADLEGVVTGPSGGVSINSADGLKFINLIVHNTNSTGISSWRNNNNFEMHGCLIYSNGFVGGRRPHGPGIYTQNEYQTGAKYITDNILWGNYSTTIQAYGSARAYADSFRIIGNISFAPFREGGRARILIGTEGRPSRDIVVNENILYEVPLQVGYTADYNYDCVVRDNIIVNAGMSINRFREVDAENNRRLAAGDERPRDPFYVALRPNKYDKNRANLAIFNWRKAPAVPVDMSGFLNRGEKFVVRNALDFFGDPVVRGTFDGRPVNVPIPRNEDTGDGEFCAFIIFREPAE